MGPKEVSIFFRGVPYFIAYCAPKTLFEVSKRGSPAVYVYIYIYIKVIIIVVVITIIIYFSMV